MRPQERDLFGQVVVTWPDVYLWLASVPRIDPHGPRAAHYIRHWDVFGKIERAKLRGEFELATAARHSSAYWWARFHWA